MFKWTNFDIDITPNQDQTVGIRVTSSPAGESPTILRPNPSSCSWYHLLASFHNSLVRRRVVQEIGPPLWEYLFPTAIDNLFRQSLATAKAQGNRLRVRLRHEHLDLVNIPWECAIDPILNDYMALIPDYSVVRYLTLPKPAPTSAFNTWKRLLVLGASPKDRDPQLQIDDEVMAITTVSANAFTIYGKAHATWFDLKRGMNRHPNIFHFCGHCSWSNSDGGMLYLETDDGKTDAVDLRRLARRLRGENVGLVVLNACVTAVSDNRLRTSVVDFPWNRLGFAQGLIREGIPAVIASLSYFSDIAAIEFATYLYDHLAQADSLDEALYAARQAIADDQYANWALPILYLRHVEPEDLDGHMRVPHEGSITINVKTISLGEGIVVGDNPKINSISYTHKRD